MLYALVEMLNKESLYLLALSIPLSFALSACGGHESAPSGQAGGDGHSAQQGQKDGQSSSHASGSGTGSGSGHSGPRIIAVTAEVSKRIDLKTEMVTVRDVVVPLHLTGRIEPDYGREVDVSARISGRVSNILVRPGEMVKQGQILALIDSPQISDLQGEAVEAKSKLAIAEAHAERERQIYEEQLQRPKALLEAQATLQNSQVHAELSEQELKRQEDLYREKIAATKDYLTAKANYAKAKVAFDQAKTALAREEQLYKNRGLMKRDYQLTLAEVARDKQHLATICKRLDFLGADKKMTQKVLSTGNINGLVQITAPITAALSRYDCAVGEVVQPEKSMFKLTDLKFVQVSADLPEVDLPRVKLGDKVVIKIASYPDSSFTGVISYISVNVHEDTRTVPIRARLANADGKLKTNMYAEIDLEGASRKFLACPKSAIQEHDGSKIVFVQRADGFEERPVKLGKEGELYCEVLSGLSDGETVATQGSLMLKTELNYQH